LLLRVGSATVHKNHDNSLARDKNRLAPYNRHLICVETVVSIKDKRGLIDVNFS
jgi:hypothetical protein